MRPRFTLGAARVRSRAPRDDTVLHSEWVQPGDIIVRQRGTSKYPGENVGLGRDHTIWSLVHGRVQFQLRTWTPKHLAKPRKRVFVHVIPGTRPSTPVVLGGADT